MSCESHGNGEKTCQISKGSVNKQMSTDQFSGLTEERELLLWHTACTTVENTLALKGLRLCLSRSVCVGECLSCITPCFVVIVCLQVFFVIRLHSQQSALNLAPISDPDPPMSNDLMDGRDAFLTIAREKHYEFSSLRRAKLSSIALLYELHNQGKEGFVYNCNCCKAHVETRYHCSVCEVRNEVVAVHVNILTMSVMLQQFATRHYFRTMKVGKLTSCHTDLGRIKRKNGIMKRKGRGIIPRKKVPSGHCSGGRTIGYVPILPLQWFYHKMLWQSSGKCEKLVESYLWQKKSVFRWLPNWTTAVRGSELGLVCPLLLHCD